ncbi:MAG TPA: FlgD immunoglobulin-like domain containing protein [Bacteroidota bacterium]|nr:FlgD immunoglobulin-like domain containing protein [Bacteroidota bacterium]
MKKISRTGILLTLSLSILLLTGIAGAAERGQNKATAQPAKVAVQEWKFFDGNTIQCTINSAGPYCDYLRTESAGLFWPKGTNKTAVYTAGIWVIGVHHPSGALRTAVEDYLTEYQSGPILTSFNTTTNDPSAAANPNDAKYHLYKVNKSDASLPAGQRNPDYDNWPGDLGAPYVDVNGNGVWDPGIDQPKLYGDQELWCVYNDANVSNHLPVGGTAPMGIEVQATYFGFNQPNALGNTMFVRWKIINKSDADYDSLFISMWSDIDLGDGNDDMIGCDTTRSLTYVYNGDNDDATSAGYGTKPPADGFVFFEGPMVKGGPLDSAISEGKWKRGYKNLKATSNSAFFNTHIGDFQDPPLGNVSFAQSAYEYQNGISGTTHQPIIDPTTNLPCKYVFPGDPVTETGWTMTRSGYSPQDVRGMISTGPINLAKGDTQEVVGAFVIAQGKDRLQSVTLLRQYCDEAQAAFNANFGVPAVKVTPTYGSGTTQLGFSADGRLLGATQMSAKITDASGSQVATFNLYDDGAHNDGVAGDKIFGNSYSLTPRAEGLFLNLSVVNSSGQSSYWPWVAERLPTSPVHLDTPVVFSDNLNDDGEVNNGENVRYGFTVQNSSSFSFTNVQVAPAGAVQGISFGTLAPGLASLLYNASDPNTYLSFDVPAGYTASQYTNYLTIADDNYNLWQDSLSFPVVPYQQKLAVLQHIRGMASGSPVVSIISPQLVKSDLYLISGVDSVDAYGNSGITVFDSTQGEILLQNSPLPDALGQSRSLIFDGFKIFPGALQSLLTAQALLLSPDSLRWFTGATGSTGAMLFGGAYLGPTWNNVSGPSSLTKGDYRTVEIRFSPKKSYTDLNSNGRYDVGEPYVVDSLNTGAAQKAFFYAKPIFGAAQYTGFHWVPFAVYDMDVTPPRQLTVIVLDNEKNNQWDVDPLTGTPLRNYVWILANSYDPSGTLYDPTQGGADFGALSLTKSVPYFDVLWLMAASSTKEAYSSNFSVTFVPSHPISSKDAYLFNPTIYTGVVSRQSNLPASFWLDQNYPNPFNPSTSIRYQLAATAHVSLKIYDVLGREVINLVGGPQTAGTHEVVWNGKNSRAAEVASGIYFYELRAGNYRSVKKMVLLR